MENIGSFLRTLRSYVTGVPDFMAEQALMQSAREFCRKGLCWTHDVDVLITDARSYPLDLPEFTLPNTIIAASLDGSGLASGADYELSATSIVLKRNVYPGQTLKVILSVVPAKAATAVHSDLYERWDMAIAKGAAAELGAAKDKAWSLTAGEVERHRRDFINGYQSARSYTLNNANRIYETQTRHDFY